MQSRTSSDSLENILEILTTTENKSLFGRVSSIHHLSRPPIPLTTMEMHKTSGDLIRNAQHEVLLAFYKFSAESEGGLEIISALSDLRERAEKDQQPINVYILINSRSQLAETFYKSNKPTGLETLVSSDYLKITTILHRTMAFGTLHSKLIIIDSAIAMVRGGDPQSGNDFAKVQFETASLIQGPLAADIRADFMDVWETCTPIKIKDCEVTFSESSESCTTVPCLYVSKRADGNPLKFKSGEAPYKLALMHAIDQANESVDIMTSNINDPDICAALANACSRGVTVNIVTGKHHNDSTEKRWGGTNLYAISTLIRQIPKEYLRNLNVHWNTNNLNEVVSDGKEYTVHAKYVCIDNRLIFTGSSPLDKQGMYYSREADIIFEHPETAREYHEKFFFGKFATGKDYFEDLFNNLMDEIEVETTRIESNIYNDLRKTKAEGLRAALNTFITYSQGATRENVFSLLETTIPLLQIRTGNYPGMPDSYKAIFNIISDYGLVEHLSYISEMTLPPAEDTGKSSSYNSASSSSSHTSSPEWSYSGSDEHSLSETFSTPESEPTTSPLRSRVF